MLALCCFCLLLVPACMAKRLTLLRPTPAADAGEHETRFQSSQAALQGLKADREAAAAQHQVCLGSI